MCERGLTVQTSKIIEFTIIVNRKKQQIYKFEKLELETVGIFAL